MTSSRITHVETAFLSPLISNQTSSLFRKQLSFLRVTKFSQSKPHLIRSVQVNKKHARFLASLTDDQEEYVFQPSPFRKERMNIASKFDQSTESNVTASAQNEDQEGPNTNNNIVPGQLRFETHDDLIQNLLEVKGDPLEKHGGRIVTYRGSPKAKLIIVGEAPGAEEDLVGKPFVGKGGQLIDRIFKYGGFDVETQIYVTNIVRRRPPKNRNPTPEEVNYFLPYLKEEIRLIDPKIVILAGRFAMEGVLGLKLAISKARGRWYGGDDEPFMMPIFHPAYLLRSPSQKKHMVTDIEEIRSKFHELVPEETLNPLQKQN